MYNYKKFITEYMDGQIGLGEHIDFRPTLDMPLIENITINDAEKWAHEFHRSMIGYGLDEETAIKATTEQLKMHIIKL